MFRPNRKFRKTYEKLFRTDPIQANLFLLLAEIADENGQIKTNPKELAELLDARFEDPEEYSL